MSPDSLSKLSEKIGFMVDSDRKSSILPNGARILAPTGAQIGIWYSIYDYSQVKMFEGDRIYLSYPKAPDAQQHSYFHACLTVLGLEKARTDRTERNLR